MLNYRKKVSSERLAGSSLCSRPSAFVLLLTAYCLLFAPACRQDMQDQPKMKVFRASSFFKDGMSQRPLVEGTVPRGYLMANSQFFTGKKNKILGGTAATSRSGLQSSAGSKTPGATSAQSPGAYADDIDTFPLPITEESLSRGQTRYQVFCSACHGFTGYGDGMIVRRGFRRAASFHDDRLRQAPVGHFFDAVTNGWGAMPSYATQIPVQDRWAIIAYIRALQLSQHGAHPPAGQSPTPAVALPKTTPATGGHN